MFRSMLIAAAALAALAGCSPSQSPSAAASSTPVAGTPVPPLAGMDPAAIPAGQNRGKVVQTQDGAGYTYAEVQLVTGQKIWMAGTQIAIKPGTQVEWGNVTTMRNFKSNSLGRSFQEILFVDRWNEIGKAPVGIALHGNVAGAPGAKAALPPGHPGAGAGAGPADAPAAAGQAGAGAVKSVQNAAGYSFIEVDQGGKSVWVAAMQTPMKAGDKVQWQGGMTMTNFTSRSLGRTFEQIIFASAVSVGK